MANITHEVHCTQCGHLLLQLADPDATHPDREARHVDVDGTWTADPVLQPSADFTQDVESRCDCGRHVIDLPDVMDGQTTSDPRPDPGLQQLSLA
jgi:hypothetical protein